MASFLYRVLALVLLLFVDEKPLATTIERDIPTASLNVDGATHLLDPTDEMPTRETPAGQPGAGQKASM